jgi:hypothetical protein
MALHVTLAPFAAPEKPDLCPPPGASFGKDALSYTRGDGCRRCQLRRAQPEREVLLFRNVLILLMFLDGRDPRRRAKWCKNHFSPQSRGSEWCCLFVEQS